MSELTPPELHVIDVLDTTLVFDRVRQRQMFRLKGHVLLPIGAEIELIDPNVSAKVTGVRLTAAAGDVPAGITLDVYVPAEYWNERNTRVAG